MAGNALRCMAKYLHDKGFASGDEIAIETAGGVKTVQVYTTDGLVTSASVHMGRASLDMAPETVALPGGKFVDYPAEIAGETRRITCVDMGNPHCVVFCERVDAADVSGIGPLFENAPIFPQRINTEFIRVVNPRTKKCGSGSGAAGRPWPAAPAPAPRWRPRWQTGCATPTATSPSAAWAGS